MPEHPDTRFGGPQLDKATAAVPVGRPETSPITSQSSINLRRLREAMDWSAQQLIPFRQNHSDAIRYFAGNRYGRVKTLDKTPINILRLAIDIWSRQLVSQDPRSLVLTKAAELRMAAYELELAHNHLLSKMEFGRQLSAVVRSGLFTMGIMKIGLTEDYLAETYGKSTAGQVYAEPVMFEDWIQDMNARRIEELEWMGNQYRVPYEYVMENPAFDPQVKKHLAKGPRLEYAGGMLGSETRKESDLSSYSSVMRSEYRDYIELWDIYFPQLKKFITIHRSVASAPLIELDWTGARTGPYHILTLSDVPGNLIPAGPAQHLFDMQDLLTRVFNQLGRQALRQKTLTIVDGVADSDGTGQRVMDADDGQVIRTNHIDGVKEFKTGGVEPSNFQFAVWLKETINYLGGNLDAMGGLSSQAATLGQEQLIAQSSSEMLRDMQAKVLKFTKRAMSDIAWYLYTNPVDTYKLEKKIEGFGTIPFSYGPQQRTADFFSFHIDIQPFSLRSKTPQERLSALMHIVQSVILPLAPQLEQWGIIMNIKELIDTIAKYSDLPELTNILSSQMPLQGQTILQPAGMSFGQQSSGPSRPLQSPSTTRNYVRQNVSSGGTQQNQDNQLMQTLMSAIQRAQQ